jgi:NTE family protein
MLTVSTDMVTGKPKVFYGGSISNAVMSTFSVPGLFALERRKDGKKLTDGAMYNNYPVDVVRNVGADIVIGVDITATKLTADQIESMTDALMQSFDMQGIDNYYASIEDTDLYLRPEIDDFDMLMLDRKSISTLIERGRKLVEDRRASIDSLASEIGVEGSQEFARPPLRTDLCSVSEVDFKGVTPKEEKYLRSLLNTASGGYTPDEANRMASIIRGTGLFEKVIFRFEGSEEPYHLVFDCAPRPPKELSFGVRFDTRDFFALRADARFNANRLGHSFGFGARIGMRSSISGEYSWAPSFSLPSLYAGVRAGYVAPIRGRLYSSPGIQVEMGNISAAGEAGLKYEPWRNMALKAGFLADFHSYRGADGIFLPSLFATVGADTFDSSYFPTKGFRIKALYAYHLPHGPYFKGHETEASADLALSVGPFTFNPHARVRARFGEGTVPLSLLNAVTQELPGRYFDTEFAFAGALSNIFFTETVMATAGTDLRLNFGKHHAGVKGDVMITPVVSPGVAAYYGMDSPFGPLVRAGVQWSSLAGAGAFITIGTDF